MGEKMPRNGRAAIEAVAGASSTTVAGRVRDYEINENGISERSNSTNYCKFTEYARISPRNVIRRQYADAKASGHRVPQRRAAGTGRPRNQTKRDTRKNAP